MDISKDYRQIIVREFKYAAELMTKNELAEEKMFYFSSTYGVLSRIFNLEYDPQLVLSHLILNNAYGSINARINAIKGGDKVVVFPPEYFEKLTESIETLASQIEKNEDIYKTLQKIAELTFFTTGNGYYLFQKGLLKI